MSKHNLQEYRFALDVIKDFPIILNKLLQLEKDLKPYKKFMVAGYVLTAVQESKEMLARQLVHYKTVLDKKGEQ